MSDSSVLSVRISAKTKAKLDELVAATRRSRSYLAAEAIDSWIDRKLEIIRKVQEGLEDMRNGDLVPHEEAMAHLEEVVQRAEARRNQAA